MGAGLDGLRVVLITDTHYGPIDRALWSAARSARVNKLGADVVCHTGDIADGTVDVRAAAGELRWLRCGPRRPGSTSPATTSTSARPRAGSTTWRARLGAAAQPARHGRTRRRQARGRRGGRRHRRGVRCPRTRRRSRRCPDRRRPRHCRSCSSPISPSRSAQAVRAPASICRSRATPTAARSGRSTYLVRLDQPVVHGLSRHGERTQLYTSRGTGFWGPPFRVFAPSEITLLTLRCESA